MTGLVMPFGTAGSTSVLQRCVFRPGHFQDGDVGVGVFPQCEVFLISGACLFGALGEMLEAGETQMSERADSRIVHNTKVVQPLLELTSGVNTLPSLEIRLAPQNRQRKNTSPMNVRTGCDF